MCDNQGACLFQAHRTFFRSNEFQEELNDLFNKKFSFRFHSEWQLPDRESWFSTPPWKVKHLEILKTRLNFHKSQLNDFNIEEWSSHTRRQNPAGEVGWKIKNVVNPEFLTQAWTKFYECASTYNIIPLEALSERKMVSLHLCEAPGAFITSLNHYLQLNHRDIHWKWLANTLNPYYEGNSPSYMISDDRFMLHTLDNWDFGEDNTGNLMDWENSQAIINNARSLGKVLLVTADGSIDCLQNPDAQEEVTSPLHYCEIITALQILGSGGTLVLKLFTIFEHSTVSLLYLINYLFQEVNIYKPVTSRQGNSEVYAICLNYKGVTSLENYIPILKSAYGTELYGNMALFPLEAIPENFLKQIEECANYFSSMQCQVIDNNLQAYLMQKNIAFHRDIRKIRAIVAAEFLWQYDLKHLNTSREILRGLLHEDNTINMNPRYHRGSYTERQLYKKMSLKEKFQNIKSLIQGEVLTNPLILISAPVRWLLSDGIDAVSQLTFTYGCPLKKINNSKFIFVPIFKLYQQILAEEEFREIVFKESDQPNSVNLKKYDTKIDKVICFPEFDTIESYNMYEKRCFKMLLSFLRELTPGETLLLHNLSALTHFKVSILYIITKKCFNKIGFTYHNSIILSNFTSRDGLSLLEMADLECDKFNDNELKDVLNLLPVLTTNVGDFYLYIVLYNNTFYRNKCTDYIERIEKSL